MSDQDAKEGERKQALRNVDKQTKLVENLLKTEKTMQTMLVSDATSRIVLFLNFIS